VSVGLVTAAALVPLLPRWPYPFNSTATPANPFTSVPAYFTSSAVDRIKPGSVAMTYPLAQSGGTAPEAWQLASNFRFRLVWGYAYIADNGNYIQGNTPFKAPLLPAIEGWGFGNTYPLVPPPAITVTNLKIVRSSLRQFKTNVFLMQDVGPHSAVVRQWISAALGERPVVEGGVLAWYGVGRRLSIGMKAIVLADRDLGILMHFPPSR
jgi:hypothetical protein